jgi:hypothetical protein
MKLRRLFNGTNDPLDAVVLAVLMLIVMAALAWLAHWLFVAEPGRSEPPPRAVIVGSS